jgi:hypothetical protein
LGTSAAAHAQAPAAAPPAPPPDGAHATPTLYWQDGPHRIDLGLAARVRMESWDGSSATNTDWDSYTGTRLRLSLRYAFEDQLAVFVEGQFATVHGLDADLGPPGRNYFTSTGSDSSAHGEGVRQAYLEVRPAKGAALRGGRQEVKVGTDVVYPEANWKYLKTARLGERLVGTVGWTHVERSYDAATLAVDTGPYAVYAFVGRPTTGVFDVDSAYRPLHDLVLGGATFTAKRGSWLPNTELGAFAIAYEDERPTTRGGIAGGVDVTTIGGYSLGVYPLGPAQVDAIAWFAGQTGKYGGQHHGAYAGIFEVGVQLPAVFAKPWLRLGINFASGDSNPIDGHHETFFNLLPSKIS